jgi:hypothetical protein
VHISETQSSTELWLEKNIFGLPMYLMLTFFPSPPEITNSFFNLIAYIFRDEKTTHQISGDGLNTCTYEDTSTSKRQIPFFPHF